MKHKYLIYNTLPIYKGEKRRGFPRAPCRWEYSGCTVVQEHTIFLNLTFRGTGNGPDGPLRLAIDSNNLRSEIPKVKEPPLRDAEAALNITIAF